MRTMTTAEWIREQAAKYAALNNSAGGIVAFALERLADDVEYTGAENAEDLDERITVMEALRELRIA